jgi:hypothetical protein
LGRYLQVVASQVAIGAGLSVLAFTFPGPLLWIIGPRYAHLRGEVGWVAMTASVSYVCGGMWTMNSARKWIYWWGTGFYITVMLATQATAALRLDLSRTHDVIKFGFWTSIAVLLVHISTGLYGFRFGVAKHSLLAETAGGRRRES